MDCGDALNLRVDYHHLSNLMNLFDRTACYDSNTLSAEHALVQKTVEMMWKVDYQCIGVINKGDLCNNYPYTIMVPLNYMENCFKSPAIVPPKSPEVVHENLSPLAKEACASMHSEDEDTDVTKFYKDIIYSAPLDDEIANSESMWKLFHDSMYGRSRKRFVVPTILYKGKYVSRSSTVPLLGEIIFRKGQDMAKSIPDPSSLLELFNKMVFVTAPDVVSAVYENSKAYFEKKSDSSNTDEMNMNVIKNYVDDALTLGTKATQADVDLLKALNIRTIFDLMVEHKKTKYYISCSSSEKAETSNFYEDFSLITVPYPGCEFFTDFKTADKKKVTELKFNWEQEGIDAELDVTNQYLKSIQTDLNYQDWGLVHLTSVYLLMMLAHLKNSENRDGLSVHCISGWDRTPLFVSLLRISLWADGEIHKSLDAYQMLYFTIAYDWMFFGHNRKNREKKGEQVMFFCFHFLKYIACEHYSIRSDVFSKIQDYEEKDSSMSDALHNDSCSNSDSRPSSRASLNSYTMKCSTPLPSSDDQNSRESFRKSLSPTEEGNDSSIKDFTIANEDTSGLGNSICLQVCRDCFKKEEEIMKSDRCRRILELRKAYYSTCPSSPVTRELMEALD